MTHVSLEVTWLVDGAGMVAMLGIGSNRLLLTAGTITLKPERCRHSNRTNEHVK